MSDAAAGLGTEDAALATLGPASAPARPAPAPRPQVAVVGRPNVGKSTLVNRIVGRREAIVEERPGVTRDRKPLDAEWAGRELTLVDTGGWLAAGSGLDRAVSAQAERAMTEAAAILFVVDATVGITDDDAKVARFLRSQSTPVLLVANKVDDANREVDAWAFARLGLGDPYPVSALHGRGSGDLLDALVAHLPEPVTIGPGGADPAAPQVPAPATDHVAPGPAGPRVPAVAIVGRPNVGKSTLFNRLVGDERSVVHDEPGTTRDAVDTVIATDDGMVRFVDTAGMRRRAREAAGAEYYSLVRALQAIDRADAALLVIDATAGVTRQDQRLAERLDAAGNPVVILLNKWEMLDADARRTVSADLADRLGFLAYAPVLRVSAHTGLGVHKLLPALRTSLDAYARRVPTAELNRVIAAAQADHRSPHGRILYATQGAAEPPTFTLFASSRLPPTYLRFIERRIREHFGFGPTPLELRVRRRDR